MSEESDNISFNVYEEDLNESTTLDLSYQELELVPKFENVGLSVLYLQNNKLVTLPDDFFTTLRFLMYLDLRDNRLTELPTTIKNHQTLTHLLLQNNHLTTLPNELGTVYLKVLQVNGNPLTYPPRDIINGGVNQILKYLNDKFIDNMLGPSNPDVADDGDGGKVKSPDAVSYNSVIDNEKIKSLRINLTEKNEDSDDEFNGRLDGKCHKLDRSRHKPLPRYFQSFKYLKPLKAEEQKTREKKLEQNYLNEAAKAKRKEVLEKTDKILQDRKNLQLLKNWRKNYCYRQAFRDPTHRLKPEEYPYDTHPEYLTFLTREDIEKDLPDKYRKSIVRRSKQTIPRKSNNDVHLAMKIKKLFENLESLNLNRNVMTPRTEQKVLLDEIQKITEIKQKLKELSIANMTST